MARYVAFLRGVNVGGVNLKMAEVAEAFEDAGFTAVRTVLASGNVLLDSRSRVDGVRMKAERALRDRFGYDAWVLAYHLDTVAAINAGYPFERELPEHNSYVTFVSDAQVLDELAALDPGPGETIARGHGGGQGGGSPDGHDGGVVYWQVPRAQTLHSAMGKTMGKVRYKSSTTTRNLRTLDKVLRA